MWFRVCVCLWCYRWFWRLLIWLLLWNMLLVENFMSGFVTQGGLVKMRFLDSSLTPFALSMISNTDLLSFFNVYRLASSFSSLYLELAIVMLWYVIATFNFFYVWVQSFIYYYSVLIFLLWSKYVIVIWSLRTRC